MRALAERAGAKREELIVFGRPDSTITAVAEGVVADPKVLGAEGVSGPEHVLVGSVSEEVTRHANRTVLLDGGRPGEDTRPLVEASRAGAG